MALAGTRIKLRKWIHTDAITVRVVVDAVIPDEEPSEPCLEPPALRFLDEVQRLTNAGDVDALAMIGEVHVRRSA